MHKGGNRTLSNDEVAYQYTKTFQVRHYIMVNEYDRIQWNGKIYRILDIEPDKQQMLLKSPNRVQITFPMPKESIIY